MSKTRFLPLLSRVALATVVLFGAVACGSPTSIQTGEVGRQLGARGLDDDLHQPGTFRLDSCAFPGALCPKLVRLQTNMATEQIEIDRLFLPKSSVNLSKVQVALQFRVKPDRKSIDQVFADVRPAPIDADHGETDRVMLISTDAIYSVYIQRIAPNAIVAALRDHTVDEVLASVPEISVDVKSKINEMLKGAPVEVTEVGFPNGIGEIPATVTDKMHALYAVAADRDRRIRELEADLAVETQRQAVQVIRTQNDRANAVAAGVTYAEYVQLKVLDEFADAANAGTPIALGTGAITTATATATAKGK